MMVNDDGKAEDHGSKIHRLLRLATSTDSWKAAVALKQAGRVLPELIHLLRVLEGSTEDWQTQGLS